MKSVTLSASLLTAVLAVLPSALAANTTSSTSASGKTTHYWDNCKPSCAWKDKAPVSAPVATCNKNDKPDNDPSLGNICASGGGPAYTCSTNTPWAVNDNLAYGFAAGYIEGKKETDWCCGCYELTFTSTAISGKKMIVQVTNTGTDLGANQFDLAMPGGGVGIFKAGWQTQFPNVDMGEQYGGFSKIEQCDALPKGGFQDGCKFRFNWFKNANNPTMTFKEVDCPAEITKRSKCSRK